MKVGIESLKGRLRLRFPRVLFNGNQKYLSLNIDDTAENRVVQEDDSFLDGDEEEQTE